MITVGYNYYNNIELFKKVRDYYLQFNNPNLKFLIVDDGSQDNPLTKDEIPEDWTVYRIEQDLKWNYNGSRNLLMHTTETEWNIMLDMDHTMSEHFINEAHLIPEKHNLQKDRVYNILRDKFDPEQPNKEFWHLSTYVTAKSYFWKVGGYQEETTGYGQDGKFRRKYTLDRLPKEYIQHYLHENGTFYTHEQKRRMMNIHNPNYPDRKILRFDWHKVS